MDMRKTLRSVAIGVLIVLILTTGCGKWRKFKEQDLAYKTLTGKTGHIRLYAAGEMIADYLNAEILYSSSDSNALWIKTSENQQIYWQGDALIVLNE